MILPLSLALSAAMAASAPDSSPASGTFLILNKSDATATLLDRATGEARATIPTGTGPHEAAVSADGKTAVACNYGSGPQPGSTLTVIDLPSRAKIRDIDLGEYQRPHGIVWISSSAVLVTSETKKALLEVDVFQGKVIRAIETGQQVSHMVAVTPDRSRAFVANIGSGSVTAIDLAKGAALKSIPTGAGSEGIDVSPDGKEVWVGNRQGDSIAIVDALTLEVKATIPCATFPIRVKFTPNGRSVLVSNAQSGDVAVFDSATRKEVRRIALAGKATEGAEGRLFGRQFGDSPVPVGILVTPDGKNAVIACANADVLAVLDLEKWVVSGQLQAGHEPDGMAFSPIALPASGSR